MAQIKELVDEYLSTLKENTKRPYKVGVLSFFECMHNVIKSVEEIGPEHVMYWRNKMMRSSVRYSTVTHRINALAGFLNFAIKKGIIEKNVATEVERPCCDANHTVQIESRILTEDDCRAVLRYAKDSPHDFALLLVLMSSGLEIEEVLDLKIKDLIIEEGTARVECKDRTVFLPNHVAGTIIEYLISERFEKFFCFEDEDLIFITHTKKKIDSHTLQVIVRRWTSAAGLPHQVTAYSLRMSLARILRDKGVEKDEILDLMKLKRSLFLKKGMSRAVARKVNLL